MRNAEEIRKWLERQEAPEGIAPILLALPFEDAWPRLSWKEKHWLCCTLEYQGRDAYFAQLARASADLRLSIEYADANRKRMLEQDTHRLNTVGATARAGYAATMEAIKAEYREIQKTSASKFWSKAKKVSFAKERERKLAELAKRKREATDKYRWELHDAGVGENYTSERQVAAQRKFREEIEDAQAVYQSRVRAAVSGKMLDLDMIEQVLAYLGQPEPTEDE